MLRTADVRQAPPVAGDASRTARTAPASDALRRALLVVVPAWLLTRALALVSLHVARITHGGTLRPTGDIANASGWWVWDAGWYRALAEHGYAGAPHGGVRFFPLFPLVGRGLGWVLGGRDDIALIAVANVAAIGYGVAVVLLARRELGWDVARRTGWLTLLAPGAVVLALAYTEPVAGLLAAAYLLAVRAGGRWVWWAVPVGALVGLSRPTGVVIAVVPAVELLTRPETRRHLRALLAAAAAPIAGAAVFCAWSASVYGNALLPYSSQSDPRLRGTIIGNPVSGLLNPPPHGGLPPAANVAMAVGALALLVVAWRVLPPSIAAWSTLLVVAAVTSAHATSLPRYLSADFPLLIALATLTRGRIRMAVVAGASAAGFVAAAVSGFGGGLVP